MNYKQTLLTVSCIGLCGLSQNLWAACSLAPDAMQEQTLNLDLGNISIDPKLPVGAVLHTRDFSLAKMNQATVRCDSSGGSIKGIIQGGQLSQFANVYRSNIAGVGLRFSFDHGEAITFPYQALVHSAEKALGQQLTVELVKTDMLTGAGPLQTGMSTYFYFDGDSPNRPILKTQIQANSIVLNNPSCGFNEQSILQNIHMQPIKATQLTAVGQTAGRHDFVVGFVCAPGQSAQSIQVSFDYQRDPTAIAANVLKNRQAMGDAQGVGIALYLTDFSNHPVIPKTLINFRGIQTQLPQIKLAASYYKTAEKLTPGQVYATMTMNMVYQ